MESEIGMMSVTDCLCRIVVVQGLFMAVAGCGKAKSDHLQNLVPVRGVVLFQGEPTPGAMITFHSDDETMRKKHVLPSAIVDQEGTFAIQTAFSREVAQGIPSGQYAVAITWKKPQPPGSGDDDAGPEILPKKYQDPKTSGLSVNVVPGMRELDLIELVR